MRKPAKPRSSCVGRGALPKMNRSGLIDDLARLPAGDLVDVHAVLEQEAEVEELHLEVELAAAPQRAVGIEADRAVLVVGEIRDRRRQFRERRAGTASARASVPGVARSSRRTAWRRRVGMVRRGGAGRGGGNGGGDRQDEACLHQIASSHPTSPAPGGPPRRVLMFRDAGSSVAGSVQPHGSVAAISAATASALRSSCARSAAITPRRSAADRFWLIFHCASTRSG